MQLDNTSVTVQCQAIPGLPLHSMGLRIDLNHFFLIPSMDQHLASELDRIVNFLQGEYGRLQTGRASASLVEHLNVEAYGSMQPLKNLANISVPEARQIVIQPWDKGVMAAIEKAINTSNLGLNPLNDGLLIRLTIPQLTEERRKEMVKLVGKLAEEARISVRNVRQDALKKIKKDEVGEDEAKRLEGGIQGQVEKANERIDEIAKKKEEDVMKV